MSRTRRRTRTRAIVVTIRWRDIPAQVNVERDGASAQAPLPARFQRAIDRAAAVAGCTDAHSYVAGWRRTTGPAPDGDPRVVADAEAGRLEAMHPPERLEELVAAGGIDPTTPEGPAP